MGVAAQHPHPLPVLPLEGGGTYHQIFIAIGTTISPNSAYELGGKPNVERQGGDLSGLKPPPRYASRPPCFHRGDHAVPSPYPHPHPDPPLEGEGEFAHVVE
jgi:hypothetical protein